MTIATITTHNPATDLRLYPAFASKLNAMIADGKTDGQYTHNEGPYPPLVVTRTWSTLEAAEEWRSFMLDTFSKYGVVSVEIQQT